MTATHTTTELDSKQSQPPLLGYTGTEAFRFYIQDCLNGMPNGGRADATVRGIAEDLAVDIPTAREALKLLKERFFEVGLNALSKGLPAPQEGRYLVNGELDLEALERNVEAIGDEIKGQLRKNPWSNPIPPEGIEHTLNINNFVGRISRGLEELRGDAFFGPDHVFSTQELKRIRGFERLAAGLEELEELGDLRLAHRNYRAGNDYASVMVITIFPDRSDDEGSLLNTSLKG